MRAEEMLGIGELMEIKIGNIFVKTKLQDLIEGGGFTVLHPTIKSIPVMLQNGDLFNLRFYRANGIYSFDALLQDWYKTDEIRLCRFLSQTEVTKAQRRRCYRLPIVLDMTMRRTDDSEEGADKPQKGKTIDISEQGVLLTSFAFFPEEAAVDIELKMSPSETMGFQTKVLRCERPVNKQEPNRIVLLFINSSETQSNYLSRYILRQQIIARKKKNQEVEL